MAQLELDPLFVKALRLLHSKAKDSAEQLRQLIEDTLAQRQVLGGSGGKDTKSLLSTIKLVRAFSAVSQAGYKPPDLSQVAPTLLSFHVNLAEANC